MLQSNIQFNGRWEALIKFKNINIKSPRFRFELDINTPITILRGDSATGKTLLIKMIEMELKDPDSELYGQGLVYNNNVDLSGVQGKIVFIDNFDSVIIESPNIVDIINKNHENQYVIIARGITGFKLPVYYYGSLFFNENAGVYHIKYLASDASSATNLFQ